jgi:hypothetical protein
LTPPWIPAFLAAIEQFPHIGLAAKAVKIARSTHYRALKDVPDYGAQFAESWAIGVGRIRDAAIKRAVLGFEEPVIYKGEYQWFRDPKTKKKRLVTVTKFPERLMMKVLGAEIPDVYNKGRIEHSGPNGGPIQASIEVRFIPAKK